jgi:magnesium-transporting ATPase (P-type)
MSRYLTYILVHNAAELVPVLAYALLPIPLPLTPIQALVVDMGTDSLTALGLGIERPDPRQMRRPPRPQDKSLLSWSVALRAYGFLGLLEAGAAMAAFFFVLDTGGWRYGTALSTDDPLYRAATTACLSAIVVCQIVNVYLCRSAVRSTLATGLWDNSLIVAGVGLEIVLVVVIAYVPVVNDVLATAPLDIEVWLFMLPFAVGLWACEEARKAFVRRVRLPDRGIQP